MKGRRGLTPRILTMFEQGYSVPDIAKAVGCSRANVHQLLVRKGFSTKRYAWNGYVSRVPPKYADWLEREAKKLSTTVGDLVRALLVDAIELAIEEEADLLCKKTTTEFEATPLPKQWKVRIGSRPIQKT